jgi:hypothetical protein
MGNVVPGLKETLDNIRCSDKEIILVNLFVKGNMSITFYTDPSFTVVFGKI